MLACMANTASECFNRRTLACILIIICFSCSQSNDRKYFNAGTKKSASGDYAGAIADYDRAIQINPNYVKAYNNSGIAKDALKDQAGAIADYDKAIELNPLYAKAYTNRTEVESLRAAR